jgi:NADH dehydrogenase
MTDVTVSRRHRVVILGGGFGGLYAARRLVGAPVDVVLIDRRNFHLFSPLLYQVATGALAPAEIAQPLRLLLRGAANVQVLLGEATGLDPAAREVVLADGARIGYDTLVVATGVRHSYFGHDEWEALAPGLKTMEDALDIRRRVLLGFEYAEREAEPAVQQEWMSFVVVGGGPTGVELAGALGEIASHAMRHEFRRIEPPRSRVILVEALDRILPTYPPRLSASAARSLAELGVDVRTATRVTGVDAEGVTVVRDGVEQRIAARTVLWAAGVRAEPFGRATSEALGAEVDRAGRIPVGPDLTVAGHPDIFVIGDLALARSPAGQPVPGVAQGAIQEGRYVARAIRARLAGQPLGPFRYRDLGELATIGRLRGVADLRRIRLEGFVAWVLWLVIHLFWLIGLQSRIIVFIRWAWSFFTRGRANRLITGRRLAV